MLARRYGVQIPEPSWDLEPGRRARHASGARLPSEVRYARLGRADDEGRNGHCLASTERSGCHADGGPCRRAARVRGDEDRSALLCGGRGDLGTAAEEHLPSRAAHGRGGECVRGCIGGRSCGAAHELRTGWACWAGWPRWASSTCRTGSTRRSGGPRRACRTRRTGRTCRAAASRGSCRSSWPRRTCRACGTCRPRRSGGARGSCWPGRTRRACGACGSGRPSRTGGACRTRRACRPSGSGRTGGANVTGGACRTCGARRARRASRTSGSRRPDRPTRPFPTRRPSRSLRSTWANLAPRRTPLSRLVAPIARPHDPKVVRP